MYYNNRVVRIGKGTVDFIVKDWDTWKRLKQNSAAYAQAADYFRGKKGPIITDPCKAEIAESSITQHDSKSSGDIIERIFT